MERDCRPLTTELHCQCSEKHLSHRKGSEPCRWDHWPRVRNPQPLHSQSGGAERPLKHPWCAYGQAGSGMHTVLARRRQPAPSASSVFPPL